MLGKPVCIPSKVTNDLAVANESMALVTQGQIKEAHRKLIEYINATSSKSEVLKHIK